jgi:hypothetical protein
MTAACIHPPDLVIVDRKTALEQQAQGRFRHLEDELDRTALKPTPEPLTRGQIEAAVAAGEEQSLGEAGRDLEPTQVDELLVRRCVGESLDGTLTETAATCVGTVDVAKVSRSIERTNRNRFQVWRYLNGRRPGTTLQQVRRAWRTEHLEGVVCGAQIQNADGTWSVKKC